MRARIFVYHVNFTIFMSNGKTGYGDSQYIIPTKKLTEPSIKRLNDFIKEKWEKDTGYTVNTVVINSYRLVRESRG